MGRGCLVSMEVCVIIGHGMLATRFAEKYADDDGVVIFASGVSNSGEWRKSEFDRETDILQDALARTRGKFVYFSSCGVAVAPSATQYMQHKAHMESLTLASPNGLVLRLPQVVGKTSNPYTLTNYLHSRITSGTRFDVWSKAERNLIDIDDVFDIGCEHVATTSAGQAVSIASNETLPMPRIVAIFEQVIGKHAEFDVIEAGDALIIDSRASSVIADRLGIHLGHGYTETIIRKYYG